MHSRPFSHLFVHRELYYGRIFAVCGWPDRLFFMVNVMNPARIFAYSLLLPILAGCLSDNDSALRVSEDSLSAPIPAEIRQVAALGNLPLEIQVSVNGTLVRQVPATGTEDNIPVVVNLPADQNNTIDLAWFATVNAQKLLLADFSTVITPGTSEIDVSSYNSVGDRFDEDGDNLSNLKEAQENRNLLSEFDVTVPFQTTFGGVFSDILSDGIDPDTSGGTVEVDDPSSFALRHDGTNMEVYICGRDQTLQGDNEAGDGQYWHDDTVFIFLDGNDSDSSNYDNVDDFQIGFVRSTNRMVVSKGAGNQFCPQGACITPPTFFNASSNCEYELIVSLPMAELNITPGTAVGFDIEITDDDDGGLREGSSAWIGFNDRSDLNPSTFGTITLSPVTAAGQ
jgi:hypothetical protein